jgi:predicted RNA-binding protein
MCLSTVCLNLEDARREIMRDVARIEAEGDGYWLIDLFGERTFVEGAIESIDLVDENLIMLAPGSSLRQ